MLRAWCLAAVKGRESALVERLVYVGEGVDRRLFRCFDSLPARRSSRCPSSNGQFPARSANAIICGLQSAGRPAPSELRRLVGLHGVNFNVAALLWQGVEIASGDEPGAVRPTLQEGLRWDASQTSSITMRMSRSASSSRSLLRRAPGCRSRRPSAAQHAGDSGDFAGQVVHLLSQSSPRERRRRTPPECAGRGR